MNLMRARNWNKFDFRSCSDDTLQEFAEIFLSSIEEGKDFIDIGKALYEFGLENKIPGFSNGSDQKKRNLIKLKEIFKKF